MIAEIVQLRDLTECDRATWRELGARALSPNPFAEPSFVLPATDGLRVDDVGLLVVRERDEWLLTVPVRKQRAWHGVPGRCLSAWVHPYCFLGTPLVQGSAPEETLAVMIDRATREAPTFVTREAPTFVLDMFDADGPLAEPLSGAMRARAEFVVLREIERPVLRLGPDGKPALGISAKHRSELRRLERRLADEVGPLTLRDRSGNAVAYDEFLSIERSGWKGAAGTALACDPGHAHFFREMCSQFARAGRLQLWALGNEQHTVAMACMLLAGEGAFGFKTAYDEACSRTAPGIQLTLGLGQRALRSGAAWIDSCSDGDGQIVTRLWKDRRRVAATAVIGAGGASSLVRLKWRAAAAAAPAHARLRRRSTRRPA